MPAPRRSLLSTARWRAELGDGMLDRFHRRGHNDAWQRSDPIDSEDWPACPSCGCLQTQIIQPAGQSFAGRGLCLNSNCGVTFKFIEEEADEA